MTGLTTRLVGENPAGVLIGLALGAIVAILATLVAAHWWRRGERVFAVAIVGVATCLASPLSWTHHWVWVLPLSVVAFSATELPRWAVWVSRFLVGWVSLQLGLSVLPYGPGAVANYNLGQQLIANLTVVLASALIVGLAWAALKYDVAALKNGQSVHMARQRPA